MKLLPVYINCVIKSGILQSGNCYYKTPVFSTFSNSCYWIMVLGVFNNYRWIFRPGSF